MDCQDALLKINGLMDREIDSETQQAVLAHLKDCAGCSREAKIFGILRAKLQQIQVARTQTTAGALIAHRARVNRVRFLGALAALFIAVAGLFVYYEKSEHSVAPVIPAQPNPISQLLNVSDVHNRIATQEVAYEKCNGAGECCMCMRRYVERLAKNSDLKIVGFMCPCKKFDDAVIVMNYNGDLVTARILKQFPSNTPAQMKFGDVGCYALKDTVGNNVAVFCLKKNEAIAMVGKTTTPEQFASLLAIK